METHEHSDSSQGQGNGQIKVRRRVRIKKKKSRKRKYKKYLEYFIWITLIIGFIVSLMILVKQLDISDKKYKKKKKENSELLLSPGVQQV